MIKRKKSAILGMGVTGQAVLHYLLAQGEEPLLLDKNPYKYQLPLPIYPDQIDHLDQVERLIISPGVPENHPLREEAIKRGIEITSEIELALLSLQGEPVQMFAITGSCGKTTTTSLVTHVLQAAGKKCKSYGNIGYPLLNYWLDKPDYAIVELSSFQLAPLQHNPLFAAAVILNIVPNHLDHHSSMEAYVRAKMQMGQLLKEKAPLYISEKIAEEWGPFLPSEKNISFFDKEKVASIFSLSYRDGRFKEFAGDHQNSQAAYALCQEAGLTKEEFLTLAASFQKPEHRFEWVTKINEVVYINDSKATTTLSVKEAVDTVEGKVILIAGGVDKGGDFTSWKETFVGKVAKLLLIGRDAPRLSSLFSSLLPVEEVETLERAVAHASKEAKPGDCVLLSPGCASFDQFENYEHRGRRFKELVLELEGAL